MKYRPAPSSTSPVPPADILPALAALAATLIPWAPLPGAEELPGERVIAATFAAETARLAGRCLEGIETRADWEAARPRWLREFKEMIGLEPEPERTPLHAVVTGRGDHGEFVLERLHFQPLPHYYATANLYLPKDTGGKPAPAVLYVCGHANPEIDGVSYGNKFAYHHHGVWLARHGYVCLTFDTVERGEIRGVHHGTYRYGRWWWNARGYTPLGVEAWAGTRAVDYLVSRPEVDPGKIGVTGRSGGGIYSWATAAIDERIGAAVPVAGLTDLQNHVVDGVVEGHCDCMYFVNTYRWDHPQLAALIAPRPLLLANSDKDGIFPLDGVIRTHRKLARLYRTLGAEKDLGLLITEGPHKDTQDLQVPAFRWFNRHLKKDDFTIERAAVKVLQPAQVKVLPPGEPPAGQINTEVDEHFVPRATLPAPPADAHTWRETRERWLRELRSKCFAGWPDDAGDDPLDLRPGPGASTAGLRLRTFSFTSQDAIRLTLYAVGKDGEAPRSITLHVLDEAGWALRLLEWAELFPGAVEDEVALFQRAGGIFPETGDYDTRVRWKEEILQPAGSLHLFLAPRGIGPTVTDPAPRARVQLRRRFMLLGQTLDGMRAYDIRRALGAIRETPAWSALPLTLEATGTMAANALYAALFGPGEEPVARLELTDLPATHRDGPDYLNVLRVLDLPAALALAAERFPVTLRRPRTTGPEDAPDAAGPEPWAYPAAVLKALGLDPGRLRIAD